MSATMDGQVKVVKLFGTKEDSKPDEPPKEPAPISIPTTTLQQAPSAVAPEQEETDEDSSISSLEDSSDSDSEGQRLDESSDSDSEDLNLTPRDVPAASVPAVVAEGGAKGKQDSDDDDDDSSIDTVALLGGDPLYLVLSEFLVSKKKENLAEVVSKLNDNVEKLLKLLSDK